MLALGWTRSLTVNASNETIEGPIDNGFVEIRRRIPCADNTGSACAERLQDAHGVFAYGSVVAKDAVTFKASKDYTGIFFKGQLIGILGESLCRDSQIGKDYVFPVRTGSTELRTYAMVGCKLPQMVNEKYSSIILMTAQKPIQRAASSAQQSQ